MSTKGQEIVAKCFDDPRVFNPIVDYGFHEVLAEKFEEYIRALQWCGGAPAFQVGGEARKGWVRTVQPLI